MNKQRKIYLCVWFVFMLAPCLLWSQHKHYSLNNVHSHNDYWQKKPFYLAYENGLGSVEADTYLWNSKLLVAHDTSAIRDTNSLQTLYLDPLKNALKRYHGYPFVDTSLSFQLLIELKSNADEEIKAMANVLKYYPTITNNKKITVVFTGNTPTEKSMSRCPSYMQFDGQLSKKYTPTVLSHMAMLSDNLQYFIRWNGKNPLTEIEKDILHRWVKKGHDLGKKVRFWNAPDNVLAWKELMSLGVDYINTDHIESVVSFFRQ